MDLAKLIRTKREARGWTQEELAEKIGRDQNFISSIEIGRTKRPRSENLRALMDALGIDTATMAQAVGVKALAGNGDVEVDIDEHDPYVQIMLGLITQMSERERDVMVSVAQLIVRGRAA